MPILSKDEFCRRAQKQAQKVSLNPVKIYRPDVAYDDNLMCVNLAKHFEYIHIKPEEREPLRFEEMFTSTVMPAVDAVIQKVLYEEENRKN